MLKQHVIGFLHLKICHTYSIELAHYSVLKIIAEVVHLADTYWYLRFILVINKLTDNV